MDIFIMSELVRAMLRERREQVEILMSEYFPMRVSWIQYWEPRTNIFYSSISLEILATPQWYPFAWIFIWSSLQWCRILGELEAGILNGTITQQTFPVFLAQIRNTNNYLLMFE